MMLFFVGDVELVSDVWKLVRSYEFVKLGLVELFNECLELFFSLFGVVEGPCKHVKRGEMVFEISL